MDFIKYITDVKDFPSEGILFHDITTLLEQGPVFKQVIEKMAAFAKEREADVIVGPEARGFIFGCPVAYALEIGFVPVRKKGKLPRETLEMHYGLEYGTDVLCIHKDAIRPGQKVLITDDLLATGGTIEAAVRLIEALGGVVVGACFLIELTDLKGRDKLSNMEVRSFITY